LFRGGEYARQREIFLLGGASKIPGESCFGNLPTSVGLLAFSSLIVNPVDLSGGIVREFQGRLSIVFIGMIVPFGLGMASWMVGCDAVPRAKSQPHWKMCRTFAIVGTGFGLLAILVYLAYNTLLPTILPVLK
jgi:hypothetical protein